MLSFTFFSSSFFAALLFREANSFFDLLRGGDGDGDTVLLFGVIFVREEALKLFVGEWSSPSSKANEARLFRASEVTMRFEKISIAEEWSLSDE